MRSGSLPPQIQLDRRERDALWRLAADDLSAQGDILYHCGLQGQLGERAQASAAVVQVISLLLEVGIGWDLDDDPRDTYAFDVPRAEFAAVLTRWLEQVDGVLADEAAGPEAERDAEQLDADLEARAVVSGVLDQVRPHLGLR